MINSWKIQNLTKKPLVRKYSFWFRQDRFQKFLRADMAQKTKLLFLVLKYSQR